MQSVTANNFGPLIAYLIPGFVVLWGLRPISPTVEHWLSLTADTTPTVGGFLYITLASLAAGLIVSAIRWALVDRLLHWTGIRPADWNFARFPERVEAFLALVENTYRYYQFYANALVAVIFSFVMHLATRGWWPLRWSDLGYVAVGFILLLGARDTLSKYYKRGTELMQTGRRRH